MSGVVPTTRTRRLAAMMTQAARTNGPGEAAGLLAHVERGQEVALVVALLGLVSGGVHDAPGPAPTFHYTPVADLIACGTCGAKIHEACRTKGGRSRADHDARIMERRCPCGEPIPKRRGQRWCQSCRDITRRANQQRYDQQRRLAS